MVFVFLVGKLGKKGIVCKIDWDKAIEFLDKELSQLFPESESSLRHADKLFKVWLKGR